MNIRSYLLKEVANTVAYWISPKGEIIPVDNNHIDVIIKNPSKFGLSSDYVEKTYEKYSEPMGMEGKAREEIILKVVRDGWIRVRRYRNQGYSINISRFTKKVKDILFDWVDKLVTTGVLGAKERDVYIPVAIVGFGDNTAKNLTLKDIQKGMLYEGVEKFDESNKIIICESIEDVHEERKQ